MTDIKIGVGGNAIPRIIEVMEMVKPYLSYSMDTTEIVNAVYYTPAQSLRNAANAIERKDAAIDEFNTLLRELKSLSD